MPIDGFGKKIQPFVDAELRLARQASRAGRADLAFRHLERAHVLGQASTVQHVRVHLWMLRWALRHRRPGEVAGQLLRIAGAAVNTALGLVPEGNTGGSNVSPFRPLPIPAELGAIIRQAHT